MKNRMLIVAILGIALVVMGATSAVADLITYNLDISDLELNITPFIPGPSPGTVKDSINAMSISGSYNEPGVTENFSNSQAAYGFVSLSHSGTHLKEITGSGIYDVSTNQGNFSGQLVTAGPDQIGFFSGSSSEHITEKFSVLFNIPSFGAYTLNLAGVAMAQLQGSITTAAFLAGNVEGLYTIAIEASDGNSILPGGEPNTSRRLDHFFTRSGNFDAGLTQDLDLFTDPTVFVAGDHTALISIDMSQFYNFTVSTPIPLPGTVFLLGSGLIGLLGWRLRPHKA